MSFVVPTVTVAEVEPIETPVTISEPVSKLPVATVVALDATFAGVCCESV